MEDGGESTEFNVQLAGIFRNIQQTCTKQGARDLTSAFALCLLSADYGVHTLLPLKNSIRYLSSVKWLIINSLHVNISGIIFIS